MSKSQRRIHSHLKTSGFLIQQEEEQLTNELKQFGLTVEGYLSQSLKDRFRTIQRLKEFNQIKLVNYLKAKSNEQRAENNRS